MRDHRGEAGLREIGLFGYFLRGTQRDLGRLARLHLALERRDRLSAFPKRRGEVFAQFGLSHRPGNRPRQAARSHLAPGELLHHEIVARAGRHVVDGGRFVALTGYQDDRARLVSVIPGGLRQEFETGHVGQTEIQQYTIEFPFTQCREANRAVRGLLDFETIARLPAQKFGMEAPVGRIVADDQQAIHAVRVWHHHPFHSGLTA